MIVLGQYKKRFLRYNTGICYRKFSAVSNVDLDGTKTQECIPWVGQRADPVRLVHEILQACSRTGAIMEGQACHSQIIRMGFQTNTLTSNMLINLYSKCGLVDCARKVFDELSERSLVSWNTMIGSLTRSGEEREALGLFLKMQREGNSLSEFTVSSVLCACAGKFAVFECKQLHAFAVKASMDSNVFVGTALLDVYAKCGFIKEASCVFDCMPYKSLVTWSSMMAGYVQTALYEEALALFHKAQVLELEADPFVFSSAICACAGLASLNEGNQVHAALCKAGFGSNIFIASSLIDMYAKCGGIEESYTVFRCIEERNIVLWNAMISGFARHARSLEVMILFEKMQQISMFPNEVTYISVLSACSHMGLVENGKKYFELMSKEHNVSPNAVHYSTMVDILGRTGLIVDAHNLIENMPFSATASMWGSLLASCKIHGNLQLAEVAAEHLFEMEPENAGNHILLSNIYAANKKWEEVARTRMVLKESEVKKERGKSWIEVKNRVHSFMVGERNHPRIADIYSKLDDLVEELKKLGYLAKAEDDLHRVEDCRKQELLRHHSEKLAVTFGLMCLPPSAPIRIMKNLRICGDCHSFMKFTSSVVRREIIVRDTNRFHHFKNGSCSCQDFW
ncbi:pentatricopeptide repeat-containing protein At5g04780, mitochondrial [Humulus lupulus]|uniref:pentatricopeptide repeat-containing protein At5g04780, mitochondrial n=1 Tax=Humulus lupulus TaxID=3486 RepID=UPI002B4106AB|nr:pentatricopeptide repeat-containing protein At5g04780, mitochondrial [Humulus lupulus]